MVCRDGPTRTGWNRLGRNYGWGSVRMEHLRITDSRACRTGGQHVAGRAPAFLLNVVFAVGVFLSLTASAADAGSPDDGDFERFRVIAEKNMFGRRRAADAKPETAPQVVNESALPDIRLVGIVRMSDPYSSIAIVAAGGRHRLCRVGDSVEGLILRSIRDHDIVFETPSGHWLTEIEPDTTVYRGTIPQLDPTAPGFVAEPEEPASGGRRRLPVRAIEVKQLANAGLVTYRENGAVRGLQLTRNAFGLKAGDRVTHVDGQALCTQRPKQKLWQIVRKHTASKEHGDEIHVVVERDSRTLEFLVAPVS